MRVGDPADAQHGPRPDSQAVSCGPAWMAPAVHVCYKVSCSCVPLMVSCSGFGLPMHAQLLRLFVTTMSVTRRCDGQSFRNESRKPLKANTRTHMAPAMHVSPGVSCVCVPLMVSCSGFGLPLHAQLLRLFVTRRAVSPVASANLRPLLVISTSLSVGCVEVGGSMWHSRSGTGGCQHQTIPPAACCYKET